MTRKSVFISYAHKDDTENFVSRLGYSLDMYLDAFWDVKLQIGSWENQLIKRIEECDVFLVVMSVHQKEGSQCCKREIETARRENKLIVPIRRFENHSDDELQKLEYADFSKDSDEGFKTLTYLITGERRTSWEYLYHQNDETILASLGEGKIPAIISKEFAEWLIVHRMWPRVQLVLNDNRLVIPEVFSVKDISWAIAYLNGHELYSLVNQSKKKFINLAGTIADSYLNTGHSASDTNHSRVGNSAKQIMANVKQLLWDVSKAQRDPRSQKYLEDTYSFEATSKLRELIILYSRRSRHLY